MTHHEDYAHVRDPQTERTKWELWAIVAIIVVVLACSFVWRLATHHPAKPQTNWHSNPAAANTYSGPLPPPTTDAPGP